MRFLIAFFFCISFTLGCKNSKQTVTKETDTKAKADLQSDWEKVENESGAYVLYYMSIVDQNNTSPKRDFYIEDQNGNKVFESSVYGGYVKWYDASKVEYFSTPGVMPSNMEKDDFIMIYDIDTGESYKKSSLKQ
ncbi:MAG: hypothetical protein RLN88_09655 [Ekhidna sp.]|uniref:hypothetical protein n=1 Tax=Ekhidna sp. TaxID=2608089 RepID=UPI0032EE63FE